MPAKRTTLTATHWGTYVVSSENGRLTDVEPWSGDPDPSPIGRSLIGAVDGPVRVARPSVRREWLEGNRSGRRGSDPFVEVSWDEALDLVAAELERIRSTHGNSAIYGGSYGWASAGRFHHAQSQIHRFLGMIGGYTSSVLTYSSAAGEAILPHIIGSMDGLVGYHSTWDGIAEQGGLVVAFGGLPRRNSQVQAGGLGRHEVQGAVRRAAERGVRFITVSPVREDSPDIVPSEWLPLRPNSDVAVMLGLAHVLITENLHDEAFLVRYCVGFDAVRAYVLGESDGVPKTPAWAASLAQMDPNRIVALARDMAAGRTMIMVNWAIQRADHGEQPYWMAVTLAALLGQIGLPGGGFGFGYSSTNGMGRPELGFRWPAFPQQRNPISSFIPVARLTDMLLDPGGRVDFNGQVLTYPDIRLIYWAGGNPFHHHQDLNRLVGAWQRPETIIVHEPYWTATARHADIVLPVTTTLERNDLAFAGRENLVVAMKQVIAPIAEARDDFAIFTDLAARLGVEATFTGGRNEDAWIQSMYADARATAASHGIALPPFAEFWKRGYVEAERRTTFNVLLGSFREDPERHRLDTPSGRIELFSTRIASFGYDDCPGHAVWREPVEWLGSPLAVRYPLHLLSPQPADKLHSQYDHGSVSRAGKVATRAPLRMNPADAAARGIRDGDVVKVFNDRGACLAGVVVTDAVLPGVVQLPTGAWYDPAEPGVPGSIEKHGNPNVLTPDHGSSRLAQAPSCNSTLVEIARFDGKPPAVTAFEPPEFAPRPIKSFENKKVIQ
ncbi:molybdopterin guanine dinucleotide-containing S/N-oxide reductase [Bradyrhizobium genosp. P]|uniref:molybdopterin guanine dinucleotide-containing S/N-oxide reductase n=1 Tax=Bradyrhizobium genosp. P TaxID=83641 RepID=UPI003CF5971D